MRFRGFDLNLLAALQALADEGSVSAAARRMHMSQPAMSAALARLRTALGDEILIPSGRRMILTPRARSLLPRVDRILGETEELLHASARFDPLSDERTLRISASDYVTEVLLTPLIVRLARQAPRIRVELFPPPRIPAIALDKGDLDLLFTPEGYVSREHPARLIFSDDHVVVGWSENPALAGPLTLETYMNCGHVTVAFGSNRELSFAEQFLAAEGHERRIEVYASSFMSVPAMLVGTERLSLMHKRLAAVACKRLPLIMVPPPVPIPRLREMAQFHRVRQNDPALQWFLDQAEEVMAS